MDDHEPQQVGMFDLTYGMSPEEWLEADQGRYLCVSCGEFVVPDGHECPSPRSPGEYPPGLLS